MKIAIIGSRGYPYVYSGYETFVKELSERLSRHNFEVTVYCHKQLFTVHPRQVNGIKLVYLNTIENKFCSQFIHSFQAVLHACLRDFDLILVVNSANGPFGLFTRIFGKKTAINVDGLEWLRPKWKGAGAKYFYWASKAATKLYDKVITDSACMQKIYKQEFGVDSAMISYGAEAKYPQDASLIERWGLEKNGYYLVVGRLIPDNNADLIIREFLMSRSRKKLVIVGDALYDDGYARGVKLCRDPRVLFCGYVFDEKLLTELYLNSFVYLHGHEFGGTNPTLLKALACGCAVMALDTVFNREVLKYGEYGIFFKKDPGDIKRMIEEAESGRPRLDSFKEKSRERIKENYTWEKITAQYLELFEKLTNKP